MFGIDPLSHELWLFWATVALINSGLAQTKNKDGLTWFALSIILGPIATLLIVMSKKNVDD